MKPSASCSCRGVGRVMLLGIAGLCLAAWIAAAVGAESRTWSDKSGKFKIEAKFVELAEGKVTLQRDDGSQVRIALEKLSDADQKAAQEMGSGESNPFESLKPAAKSPKKAAAADEDEEAPPVKKSSKKKKAAEEADEESGDEEGDEGPAGEPKLVAPKWSAAQEILAASNQEKWSVPIEAPAEPEAVKKSRPIALPAKTDFFEGLKSVAVNPVCGRAVLGYVLDRPGGGAAAPSARGARGARPGRSAAGAQSRIVLCDLQNGKMLGHGAAPVKMAPLALSDDSKQVLMRREEFGHGNADRLELWRLTKSGVQRELQWSPHDEEKHGNRDVQWAAFVDDKRFATVSGGGMLTIWQAAGAKPLYFLKIQGHCRPALSPDRKYLAFATDKAVGLLDLTAGEVAAMQAAPRAHFPFPIMAFSPSGKRLVCAAFDRVYAWDTATGALQSDVSLTGAMVHIGNEVVCPSENHVLLGKSLLVDLESQARVWTYDGAEAVRSLGPVCWFVVSSHQGPGALVPATLPHAAAKTQIEQAMNRPDFFVLKPGTTVTLNVMALQDPAERERVAGALAKKLQDNGCQVGPNGTIELAAACEMGQPRDISYRSFGFGAFGERTYKVRDFISRLKFVYQGQTAWETTAGSVPGMISLKQGESVEQVLRNSERPNYAWFASVELPKKLQKPSQGGATLGKSSVTTAGIQ